MARPNDPVLQAESFETLRRKLLRQNRELARVNSTQSLKIRQLENENARMLSENLDLRGQILQLENQLDDSKSQRIADHALEVKAKLEAQLVEWGSILAGLGLEPPTKRLDQRMRRASQPRSSLSRRSPPRKSLRDVAKDLEARAKEEGRLSPIMEYKPGPRRTMDRSEIMALCTEAEAADSSNSLDLGTPPMSRFVEEDPAPNDSPSKAPTAPAQPVIEPETKEALPSPPPESKKAAKTEKVDDTPAPVVPKEMPIKAPAAQDAPIKVLKSGAKRKYGATDDIENRTVTNTKDAGLATRGGLKSAISRERTGGRTLKQLTSIRREAREKVSASGPGRKPLAAKSTNEDVSSPKKSSGRKTPLGDKEPMKPKPAPKETVSEPQKQKANDAPKRAVDVVQPPPVSRPVAITPNVVVPPDTVAVNIESHFSPRSPELPSTQAEGRDTPPPADISCTGETSRASRRARSAVSYAEPKLNSKMRRSTKEFVDAVTGEGKYQHRSSLRPEEIPPASAEPSISKTKREATAPSTEPIQVVEAPPSPLAEKGLVGSHDAAASNVVTERPKRRSSVLTTDSAKTLVEQDDEHETTEPSITSAGTTDSSSLDVYDFPSNSPSRGFKDSKSSDNPPLRRSRSSRRSSALHDVDLNIDMPERPKSAATRKRERASMNVAKMAVPDLDAFMNESESEGVGASVRSRNAQRRKSTML